MELSKECGKRAKREKAYYGRVGKRLYGKREGTGFKGAPRKREGELAWVQRGI